MNHIEHDVGKQAQFVSEAIDRYLRLLDLPPAEDRSHLSRLARELDHLVATYNRTGEVSPEGEAEAPTLAFEPLLDKAAAAFPELGFYAHVYPDEPVGTEAAQGWALDDLADIARDFLKVRWHLENSTEEEALWHFRFGFQSHWEIHLFSLRNYLHCSTIAAW
jgi:hypothetical protein